MSSQPAKRSARRTKRPASDRSLVARLLQILKTGGDTRLPKVKTLRRSLRQRNYENDLKLSIAVDRMIREL